MKERTEGGTSIRRYINTDWITLGGQYDRPDGWTVEGVVQRQVSCHVDICLEGYVAI